MIHKHQNQKSFRLKNVTMSLIVINIVMFILQSLFPIITDTLKLVPAQIISQPWTLCTSMFLHGNLTHLFFNMYALLLFGGLIERMIGSKRFLGIYIGAGLFASVIFTVFQHTFGNPLIGALGASGAIMAVLGLVIVLLPNMKVLFFFIIPMNMRTAGIIFALIDIVGLFGVSTGIAHSAHLGGLLCGLLYALYLKKTKKINNPFFPFGSARKQQFSSFSSNGFNQQFSKKKTSSKPASKQESSYEQTIELNKDDIDNYFKFGKL